VFRLSSTYGPLLPDTENAQPGTVVLGLGNILRQDEGLGIHAVERLQARYRLPRQVRALDGGTMGLDLLPYLEDAPAVLLLDAVQTGQPPGSLVRLEGEAIPAALALKMSSHQVGLQELLATSLLRGTLPGRVVLWGIEPASIAWGLELSPVVGAAIGELVDAGARELRDWGLAVERREFQ
jgi:hydrogenase maturation protease